MEPFIHANSHVGRIRLAHGNDSNSAARFQNAMTLLKHARDLWIVKKFQSKTHKNGIEASALDEIQIGGVA